MKYNYVKIDGQLVEVHAAKWLKKFKSAFKKRWKLDLIVTSGTRTDAQQAELYEAWLNGTGAYALPPGQSNHNESGPVGPRAVDLRDSGTDAGVTVIGSERSNWAVAAAAKYHYDATGLRFSHPEGWHYEFTGDIGGAAAAGGTKTTITTTTEDDDMAHFDLIQTPDGTVWYCVDRILRYAIPHARNLDTYHAFLKALGKDTRVVQKSALDANAYGAPVYADPLDRYATPRDVRIAQKKVTDAIENLPAQPTSTSTTSSTDTETIVKAVNAPAWLAKK